MKIIFDFNRTIFNPETGTLYAGVVDLLILLSKNHDLFLISQNEPGRKENFQKLGISDYFKKIVFVEEKTKSVFEELSESAKDVMVVGDRLRGEILIGKQLGVTTI